MYDSFVVRFWVICCKIFENKSDVKEETYDTAFHLQEEEILCRDGLAVLYSFIIFLQEILCRDGLSCTLLLFFSIFLIKAFLRGNMQGMLQNVLKWTF